MSSGETWEHEVAEYLRSKNYHAKVRQDIGSHEIDVYATRGPETLIVECKDWNQKVSKDPIRTVHNNAIEIGGTPGLAYTSELTSGAGRLAENYEILLFPSEVIKGRALTLDDVRETVEKHSLSLPGVSDLSDLNDPFGPFNHGRSFSETVAKEARKQSFEMDGRHENAIRKEIERAISETEKPLCVPVLRNDQAQIDLYFIGEASHEVLPRSIEQQSISLT